MTKSQVMVASEYLATLDGNEVRVLIEGVRKKGGWTAIDLGTGQTVVIKHAGVLQALPEEAAGETETPVPVVKAEPPVMHDNAMAALEVTETTVPADAGVGDTIPPMGDAEAPTSVPKSHKPKLETVVPKKLSALDAAAVVLATAIEPMTTKQLIEAMAARGLWTSPGGKTPAATLYSALLREITTKGDQARFAKADRGRFAARSVVG